MPTINRGKAGNNRREMIEQRWMFQLFGLLESERGSRRIRLRKRLSEGVVSASRFLGAFFLSHVWCKYRSKMFLFSVMITGSESEISDLNQREVAGSNFAASNSLCSAGISIVGKYTDGLFIDDVRAVSLMLYKEKFSWLCTGRSFKKSPTDWERNIYH